MPIDATYYQSLVGILWWIVKLVRVDIAIDVSKMSSHFAFHREGRLDKLYYIFAYLK